MRHVKKNKLVQYEINLGGTFYLPESKKGRLRNSAIDSIHIPFSLFQGKFQSAVRRK